MEVAKITRTPNMVNRHYRLAKKCARRQAFNSLVLFSGAAINAAVKNGFFTIMFGLATMLGVKMTEISLNEANEYKDEFIKIKQRAKSIYKK